MRAFFACTLVNSAVVLLLLPPLPVDARSQSGGLLPSRESPMGMAARSQTKISVPGVTCHVATWFWAAKEAQAGPEGVPKTDEETLVNIIRIQPNPSDAMDILATALGGGGGIWNFDLTPVTPPDGTVLYWSGFGLLGATSPVPFPNSNSKDYKLMTIKEQIAFRKLKLAAAASDKARRFFPIGKKATRLATNVAKKADGTPHKKNKNDPRASAREERPQRAKIGGASHTGVVSGNNDISGYNQFEIFPVLPADFGLVTRHVEEMSPNFRIAFTITEERIVKKALELGL